MSEQDEIKNEIVEEQSQEQVLEKTSEEVYIEMFNFARECGYDGNLVFNWILVNAKTVEEKMTMWGSYVSEITRYNTEVKVKSEHQLKLLKILE